MKAFPDFLRLPPRAPNAKSRPSHFASSLPQRPQLRTRAEEEIPLRDRDAGAVACGIAFIFEIRGVEQFEFSATGLDHGHIGVEIHHVDFSVGGGGRALVVVAAERGLALGLGVKR